MQFKYVVDVLISLSWNNLHLTFTLRVSWRHLLFARDRWWRRTSRPAEPCQAISSYIQPRWAHVDSR